MMASEETKIGQLVDSLGVVVDLDESDMVTDAIVILKVIEEDGSVNIVRGSSESLDWISAIGMMTVINTMTNSGYGRSEEEEE